VSYAVRGGIAVVTIERPEVRNAVDQPTRQALVEAFQRFEAEPSQGVAILTGAGGPSAPAPISRRRRPGSESRTARTATAPWARRA